MPPTEATSRRTEHAGPPDTARIVATGWGAVTPLGPDVESSFRAMAEGRSGVRRVTRFDPTGLFCDIAAEVDLDWLWPAGPESRFGGSAWRLGRRALAEAVAMRPLDDVSDRSRIAVVLGGHGENPDVDGVAQLVQCFEGTGDEQRFDFARFAADASYDVTAYFRRQPDTVGALFAHELRAEGPVVSIVSACAAGTQAIGEATRMLRAGEADVVVAGGLEPLLSWSTYFGFAMLGALTRRYPSPEAASRPFDRKRNGFVIGEGAGIVVLESLAHARAAGRTPLGEVLGYGDSADAYRITDVHPEGLGAVRAMRGALADAGLPPESVQYVNAHGTSTPTNDPVETLAIKTVLGAHAAGVPVSSNKSMIGHTIAGAGALEAICTWVGMREGLLLPTINQEAPDRRCDLDYVPNEARPLAHRVALSNSFGFGGQNGCLCLGAAP